MSRMAVKFRGGAAPPSLLSASKYSAELSDNPALHAAVRNSAASSYNFLLGITPIC
jgi:hypothetical protein